MLHLLITLVYNHFALLDDNFGDDIHVSREDYGLSTASEPAPFVAPDNKHSISKANDVFSGSFNPSQIDLGAALASQYALPSASANTQKRYLTAERRSIWGQASYNIGYSYFSGLFVGGVYGVLWGIKNCQIMNFRVLMNSILNGGGKFGSRTGNAAGMLAFIYSCRFYISRFISLVFRYTFIYFQVLNGR